VDDVFYLLKTTGKKYGSPHSVMEACSQCGAVLPPEVKFCRQCGAAVTSNRELSESPTAQLQPVVDKVSTRRLHPRATSPAPELRGDFPAPSDNVPGPVLAPRSATHWKVPIAVMLLAVVLVIAAAIISIALFRPSRKTVISAETNSALIYPNSQTLLDTTSTSGRAIQLQTPDSTDQVVAWYTAKLAPTKTVRLASSTVVLKNQDVAVTIVGADGKTSILIKQTNLQ